MHTQIHTFTHININSLPHSPILLARTHFTLSDCVVFGQRSPALLRCRALAPSWKLLRPGASCWDFAPCNPEGE
ncbi:hypothetical protein CRG98_043648, partial [Punica granatum]